MEQYFRISNADGKRWAFPVRNLRTALCLYQPGGVKGKLVKAFLPCVWRLPFVQSLLSLERPALIRKLRYRYFAERKFWAM